MRVADGFPGLWRAPATSVGGTGGQGSRPSGHCEPGEVLRGPSTQERQKSGTGRGGWGRNDRGPRGPYPSCPPTPTPTTPSPPPLSPTYNLLPYTSFSPTVNFDSHVSQGVVTKSLFKLERKRVFVVLKFSRVHFRSGSLTFPTPLPGPTSESLLHGNRRLSGRTCTHGDVTPVYLADTCAVVGKRKIQSFGFHTKLQMKNSKNLFHLLLR